MTTPQFDTLTALRNLEASGVDSGHAEAIVGVIAQGGKHTVTKGDLTASVAELKAGFAELKAGFAELKAGFAELKAGFAELKASFAELKTGIADLKADFYRAQWIQGAAIVAIILAARLF